MRKFLVAALVIAGILAASAPAAAAPPASSSQTLTIDGKTYGAKDGLKIYTETVKVLPDGSFSSTTTGGISAASSPTSYYDSRGSTYVSSYEQQQLQYTGTAYAAANVYQNARWIQACFQYTRNGKALTARICSSASSASGSWRPGTTMKKSVIDTLDPYAPQTEFTRSFASVAPGVL